MISSEKNYPKSRKFTYIAVILSAGSAIMLSALFVHMDKMEKTYGVIKSDIVRYTTERDDARKQRDDLLAEIIVKKSDITNLDKTKNDLTNQQASLQKTVDDFSNILADYLDKKQKNDELDAAISIMQKQERELEGTNSRSQAVLDQILTSIKDLGSRQSKAKNDLSEFNTKIADANIKLNELNQQIDKIRAQKFDLEKAKNEFELLRQSIATSEPLLAQQFADKKNLQDQLKSTLDDLALNKNLALQARGQADKEQQDLNIILTNKKAAEDQLSSTKTQTQKLISDADNAKRITENAKRDLETTQNQADAAEGTKKNAEEKLANAISQFREIRSKIDEQVQKKTQLQAQLDGMNADLARAQLVKDQSSDLEARQKATKETLAVAEGTLQTYQSRLTDMKQQTASKNIELDGLKAEIASMQAQKSQLMQLDRNIADLKGQEKNLIESVNKLTQERGEFAKDRDGLQDQRDKLIQALAELRGQKIVLEQKISPLKDAEIKLNPKDNQR